MNKEEIMGRIIVGFITPDDVAELAVLAILAVQDAPEVDHCNCPACKLWEKVADLGFMRYDSDDS